MSTPLALLARILPQKGPGTDANNLRACLRVAGVEVTEDRLARLLEYLVRYTMVIEEPPGYYRQATYREWAGPHLIIKRI